MIEYFKKAGIATFVKNLRDHADSEKPVRQQRDTADHFIKWAYESMHHHDSDSSLRVVHINVNLHRPATN